MARGYLHSWQLPLPLLSLPVRPNGHRQRAAPFGWLSSHNPSGPQSRLHDFLVDWMETEIVEKDSMDVDEGTSMNMDVECTMKIVYPHYY